MNSSQMHTSKPEPQPQPKSASTKSVVANFSTKPSTASESAEERCYIRSTN